jgi:hypothetical protein
MNQQLSFVLRIAALYNIAWGAWQVLAPNSFFALMGMEPINHPMVWQEFYVWVMGSIQMPIISQ